MATGEHGQSLALRTRDHHQRTFQINFFKGLITFLGKTDHAIASLFEGFKGAVEIDHTRHRQMLQRTSRNLGDGSRQTCAAALRQNHAMGS